MRGRLDLARNAGPGSPAAETLSHRGGRPPRTPGRSGPWCAPKAVSAAVAAEQARRKLNEETGKYLLADQISLELDPLCAKGPDLFRGRSPATLRLNQEFGFTNPVLIDGRDGVYGSGLRCSE